MSPQSSQTDPLIGTVIHGFRVERKLGEGGMGKVFVAKHEALPIHKVVKVLLPEYSRDEQIRARFLREAEAVATMDHPHVITVDNFGALPSGELFLMMPLLSGRALDEYLHAAGKLGTHHALQIAAQVASALAHAHARGIVHRDLKPGNVFVERKTGKETVKLLDFGIAKDSGAKLTGGARTRTGMAIGTPHYMACEQYDDAGAVTPAADVFALAVVVVEMLTGDLPWGVQDPNILYFRQKTERPIFGREVPRAWIPVLEAALAPDPARRTPSARAFVVALANATAAIPPVWPAGDQIVADSAPDLIRQATPEDAAVRSSSAQIPRSLSSAKLDLTATVDARPVSAQRAAVHSLPTTLSGSNGAMFDRTPTFRKPRLVALVLLGMATAAIVGALVSFTTGAAGSHKTPPASNPSPTPEIVTAADASVAILVVPAATASPDAATADVMVPDAAVRRIRPDASTLPQAHVMKMVPDAGIADAASPTEVVRLEVQPDKGDLVAAHQSCGEDAEALLLKIVRSAPRIEVSSGGPITLAVDGKRWTANRGTMADTYVIGFFDQGNGSVIAVTVHSGDSAITSYSAVEITRFVRSNTEACSDKWRGRARRL